VVKKLGLYFMLILAVSAQSFAEEGVESASSSSFWKTIHYKSFQAAATYTKQGKGESYSGIARFNPYYNLRENIRVGASLGIAPQKLDDDTTITEVEILANGRYFFSENWSAQVSAGFQIWSCDDCDIALSAGVAGFHSLNLPWEWAKIFKDVFVQYLYVGQDKSAHQVLVGVSVEF